MLCFLFFFFFLFVFLMIRRPPRSTLDRWSAASDVYKSQRMGHAGAIISGGTGTAQEKMAALRNAGVQVAPTPVKIAELVASQLSH